MAKKKKAAKKKGDTVKPDNPNHLEDFNWLLEEASKPLPPKKRGSK